MTIQEAVRFATKYLANRRLRFPREDAELITASILKRGRAFLFAHPHQKLSPSEEQLFQQWLSKRGGHYPLQYLRGTQDFYGREFVVNPSVFIPRPETELAVEVSLSFLRQTLDNRIFVLDVGSGSGCIGISLACEDPRVFVTAVDLSSSALKVAKINAKRHNCLDRVEFLQGDALQPVKERKFFYHLVVSNPPYVGEDKWIEVEESVIKFEPTRAVFAGKAGLELYAKLFQGAQAILQPQGSLIVELGYDLTEKVCHLAEKRRWTLVALNQDLSGVNRYAVFQNRGHEEIARKHDLSQISGCLCL